MEQNFTFQIKLKITFQTADTISLTKQERIKEHSTSMYVYRSYKFSEFYSSVLTDS